MRRALKIIFSIMLIIAFTVASLGLSTVVVKSVKLNTTSVKIQVGKTFKLNVTITPDNASNKKLVFSTGNKNIATVDKNGLIKGIKPGKTVVTVTSSNNIKAKCNVTIENALRKKLTITWVGPGTDVINDGNWAEKQIEKEFNVEIKLSKLDVFNEQALNLFFASGEMTDVYYPYGNDTILWKQGILRSIPFSMVRQYAPNLAKMYDSKKVLWLKSIVPGKEDEFKSLPGLSNGISGPAFVSFYRLDWLEKLGIKPHGNLETIYKDRMWWTSEPFNIKEVEEIFTRFVNDDPDGNGKKDTYNTVAYKDSLMWNYLNIANSFGFVWNKNLQEDDRLKTWNISNGYKEFLKWMYQMNKKGLVDKEISILDFNKMWEKIGTGKVGYWIAPYTYIGPMPTTPKSNPPVNVLQNDPKAKVLITPAEKGKDGKSYGYQYLSVDGVTDYGIFIGKNVNNEKLERILRIIDYCNFDKDARVWTLYGKEGTNWNWSGKPYNSFIIAKEIKADEKPIIGNGLFRYWGTWTSDWLRITESDELGVLSDWIRDPDKGGKITYGDYRVDMFNETKLPDLNKKYNSEINTMVTEFMYKSTTGEIDPEKEWDQYVNKLMSSGLKEILDELSKAPLGDELKKGKIKY